MGLQTPTLGVRALRPVIAALRTLGHDAGSILRAAGLEESVLRDPDARIPAPDVGRVWSTAVATTGDENLGLHLAQAADIADFDLHAYAFLSSPKLAAGFDRMAAYQRLLNDSTQILVERTDRHAIVRHLRRGGLPAGRQPAEFLMAVWIRFVRLAAGDAAGPDEVRFAHPPPSDTRGHARVFRAPVRFASGENALVLPVTLLEKPCARADPGLAAVLDRHAADRLDRIGPSAAVSDRARAALGEALREGEPSVTEVAQRLRMSVRTLARALAAEGTSYRALLEQLRRELASRYLDDPAISIAEVAFLLGFKEVSAFYHAFKAWTGRTPLEFRRDRARR